MKKTSFLLGTLLLALINFVVRLLGFIYRIILSRMIGSQAIGLYQMIFPFLMVLITIPTAGIPIAVSKLVAKENSLNHRKGVYRVLTLSLLIGGLIAGILTVLVSLNMDFVIHRILKNELLYYPLLWTIPAISMITFSSILRGFFYGLKDIKPAAIAQVLEQITRISFVITLLYYIKPTHPVTAATIAIIGLTIGEFFGLLFLILQFNYKKIINNRPRHFQPNENITKTLNAIMYISIPITISRLLSVFMQTINSILIPQRLVAAGFTSTAAVDIFGKISGMAMPLLFLPFTVTTALVLNIIPNISEELAVNNHHEIANKSNLAIKITLITSIPITALYIIFGGDMATLIFKDQEVGLYLTMISYATLFLCMQNTLSGILHGLGKQVITTVNFLLGMMIQLYCTYFLVPNPKYGVNGFIMGFILSAFVICLLNLITLYRYVRIQVPLFQSILKPIFCTGMMLAMIYLLNHFYSNGGALVKAGGYLMGGLTYCVSLIMTRTINIGHIIKSIKA